MIYKALGLTALSVLAVACVDGLPNGDTDDTDTEEPLYDGDYYIDSVGHSCNATNPETWDYAVETAGWAGFIEIQIAETGDPNWPGNPTAIHTETHIMDVQGDYDPLGARDEWDMTLTRVTTPNAVVSADPESPNTGTTLFWCELDNAQNIGTGDTVDWANGSLTWMLTMYDTDGVFTDCVYYGYQAYQYWNQHLGNDCFCFEGDGSNSFCEN